MKVEGALFKVDRALPEPQGAPLDPVAVPGTIGQSQSQGKIMVKVKFMVEGQGHSHKSQIGTWRLLLLPPRRRPPPLPRWH